MSAGKREKLALDAARISKPQHSAPGDRAALRLDRAAAERGKGHGKCLAAAAQSLDRLLHRGGALLVEPAAEGERPMCGGSADERRIALDGRLVGSRRPIDPDLRLRQQQRVGPVEESAVLIL